MREILEQQKFSRGRLNINSLFTFYKLLLFCWFKMFYVIILIITN